jgi:vancomycin resistance protein YoaR
MRRVLIVLGVVVLAAVGAAVARAIQFDGAAKPGVHVLGLDLSGKSRSAIEARLRAWSRRPVTIDVGNRTYRVERGWLVSLDAPATADRALAAGSLGSLVVASRVDVQPVFRPATGVTNVLAEIATAGSAPVSSTVTLHGLTVSTTSAKDGRTLNRPALLRLLATNRLLIDAPFRVVHPRIGDAAAVRAADQLRGVLSAPIAVSFAGGSFGSLSPVQLSRALRVRPATSAFVVRVDGDRLAAVLRPRLGKYVHRARNAQFVVAGDNVHIAPSATGIDLVPSQVAAAVKLAATTNRVATIRLGPRRPDLTTSEAKALGIRHELVSYTTQMGVSSSNRIHNVHLMADFIDGTVIKPGQVFSFNDVVGPRTAERGFLEGQEIIGSLVLPSIGGGVCQTATTLFNDAFELGLPILERTNHNLYLSHYPLGRDATVSWGGPDFRFRNDLKHGLLIKTSYTDQTLTFTFYGTSEGRRVVSTTGPQTNWTSPGMNYAIDPNAAPGSVRVVAGSGELGFDVVVTRSVYLKNGKLLRHDVFKSHYIPDSSTTVYGPGGHPPGPYIVIPSTL